MSRRSLGLVRATSRRPATDADGRLRVLVVIKCLGYGGAEQLVVAMARSRDRDRFAVEVAHVLDDHDALVPQLEDAGVPVHNLGATGTLDLSWAARLRRLLVDGDFDVVHTHLPVAAAVARLVVTSLPGHRRPTLVTTEHNEWGRRAPATRLANRLTIGLDHHVLVVSEAARGSMPPAVRRRAEVLVHGIDLQAAASVVARRPVLRRSVRQELGVPDGELLALTVANLRPQKGYDVLLAAAATVMADGAPVRFAAAGSGPLAEELAERHRASGLGERFRLLGPRPDALRLMAGADLFVLASHYEGLPVAVMEASALALPMVLTAVGELPALFDDGVDALLVAPGRPPALASAVTRLVEDPGLRQRLGAAAGAGSGRFDVRTATRAVESVYAAASARQGSRRWHRS